MIVCVDEQRPAHRCVPTPKQSTALAELPDHEPRVGIHVALAIDSHGAGPCQRLIAIPREIEPELAVCSEADDPVVDRIGEVRVAVPIDRDLGGTVCRAGAYLAVRRASRCPC